MHVQLVNGEVVCRQVEALKDILQRHVTAVPHANRLAGGRAYLLLDEAQQVLLIHGRSSVYVSVNLSRKNTNQSIGDLTQDYSDMHSLPFSISQHHSYHGTFS